MKTPLLAVCVFTAAMALPLATYAQQSQPPAARSHYRGTPSQAQLQHRWMRRFGNLNLSGDQQQRIQSLINQYSQTHPAGSPPDREANRELRRQMMGVLSSDQQNQFRQEMRQRREEMMQRREQMQQGPNGQYPQGQPNGQYPQGPPNGQYPQGPPNGQYPQGPPGQQYPQAPPNQTPPQP